MSAFAKLQTYVRRNKNGGTLSLIALLSLSYVLAWATHSPFFGLELAFIGDFGRPWTALTYPFASGGIGANLVWELLLLWWLFWIGTDLERALGTARLLLFFFICTLVGALSLLVGGMVLHVIPLAVGSLIPIGALTVAWGTRNPNACVRMYGIIPLTGKWIAIIDSGVVLFAVGQGVPLLGVFGLVPLGLAWAFAANRIPGMLFVGGIQASRAAKATERREKAYYDDVQHRTKEREERERLRKLFERSLDD